MFRDDIRTMVTWGDRLILNLRIILVCGKVYPVVVFNTSGTRYVCHSYLQLISKLNDAGLIHVSKIIENTCLRSKKNNWSYRNEYKGFFENSSGVVPINGIDEIHIKYNSPIIIIGKFNWNSPVAMKVNGCLSEYDFARVVEPYVMFQEIEMYLGGVLCSKENGDISISDKDRIKQHGFDDASFRKQPTQKGRKKRPRRI